jgi:hypothetical protein
MRDASPFRVLLPGRISRLLCNGRPPARDDGLRDGSAPKSLTYPSPFLAVSKDAHLYTTSDGPQSSETAEGQTPLFRSDPSLDWSKLNSGTQRVLATEGRVFFCEQTDEASACQTLIGELQYEPGNDSDCRRDCVLAWWRRLVLAARARLT